MIMEEMIAAGIKAVIVGCYAEGLDRSWLGRSLDEKTFADLKKVREKYAISVMGEGGEYESMTLDSPLHRYPLEIRRSGIEWKKYSGTLNVEGLYPSKR